MHVHLRLCQVPYTDMVQNKNPFVYVKILKIFFLDKSGQKLDILIFPNFDQNEIRRNS